MGIERFDELTAGSFEDMEACTEYNTDLAPSIVEPCSRAKREGLTPLNH